MAARTSLNTRALARTVLLACAMGACCSVWAQAPGGPETMPDWRYSVRPGDTLLDLAQRYLREPARWARVQQLNRIADARRIPVGTVLRIPADLLRVAPASVTLRNLHGQVKWREGADAPWEPVNAGQRLGAGAQLQTGSDSSVVLVLANGTEVLCQPQSTLTLDTLSAYAGGLMADTRVRLQGGQTEIRTPADNPQQRLRVLTPGAQATVRGTVFRVGASETLTREETLSGVVSLEAASQQVQVNAAQGTVAPAGAPPLPPRPLLAAPDLSAWPTRIEHLPVQLPLAMSAGASQWWAQATDASSVPTVLAQARPGAQGVTFADLPNGELVLRVRAVDTVGLQGLQAEHRVLVHARPFAPLPLGPGAGKVIHDTRAALRWSQPVGADRYRVQMSGQADFAVIAHDARTEQLQWSAPQELPLEQSLHWRVASIDAQGVQGPWSATSRFMVRPAPQKPVLDEQAVHRRAGQVQVELPAPPPHQHYLLALAHSEAALAQTNGMVSRSGQAQLPDPGDQHPTVYLSVRAVSDDDGSQGPAAVQRITLPPPPARPWWLLLLPALLLL